jgi:hypothetical protein
MLDNNNFLLQTIKSIKDQAKGIVAVVGAIQRDIGYPRGSVVFYANENSLSLDWLLECEREGCTGSEPINYSRLKEGELITDGDVIWRVKKWTHVEWDDQEPFATLDQVYTKEDADGRFVSLEAYNEAIKKLQEDVAKKAERGEKGEKGDKGDQGPQGLEGATGKTGKSAYELAVSQGYTGALVEWLDSLKGENGKDGSSGATGLSAFEVAKAKGFTGTEDEWLESLKGESAYDIAVKNGYEGTEAEWLESLGGSHKDYDVATLEEIDSLFADFEEAEQEDSIEVASLEEIDTLFDGDEPVDDNAIEVASLEEIDTLFDDEQ